MKNRRTVLVAFLLCAAMLIGMGYAALSTTLFVKGSASITKAGAEAELDTDVYFTSAVAENCNANVDATDSDILIIRITSTNSTMAFAGNTATVKATVQNDSVADAKITPNFTTNGAAGTFSFSTDTPAEGYYTVAAGGTVEITITITLEVNVPDEGITLGATDNVLAFMQFDAEVDN